MSNSPNDFFDPAASGSPGDAVGVALSASPVTALPFYFTLRIAAGQFREAASDYQPDLREVPDPALHPPACGRVGRGSGRGGQIWGQTGIRDSCCGIWPSLAMILAVVAAHFGVAPGSWAVIRRSDDAARAVAAQCVEQGTPELQKTVQTLARRLANPISRSDPTSAHGAPHPAASAFDFPGGEVKSEHPAANFLTLGAEPWRMAPTHITIESGAKPRKALGLNTSRGYLEMDELPGAIGRLEPWECEDFLCIYKTRLARLKRSS